MQPQQYRAFAQPGSQRSPHASSQRRGGIGPMMSSGPHPSVPLTQAQIAQQQQAQAHANELAKRRSRKPTDKNIPDGVESCIIEPEAAKRYAELREAERLFDATITRKRLETLDTSKHSPKLRNTLRIWISNVVEDQIWQGDGLNVDSFDYAPAREASFRVKVEGRLLDVEGSDERHAHQKIGPFVTTATNTSNQREEVGSRNQNFTPSETYPSKYRFSHFFRSISVTFDRPRLRNGADQSVEWKSPDLMRNQPSTNASSSAEFDELTFKRNGDENANITINLFRHEIPERYELSKELADVVDMAEATQQEAVMAVWEYIRLSGLQEDEEKRNFRCDEHLKKIVGRDSGLIPMLNEYVMPHLRPLPPIRLAYTIRVDEDFHKDPQPTIYDIQVSVDDPLRSALQPFFNNSQYASMLKEVMCLDEKLARLIQAVSLSKAKHSFFISLGGDPANFVKNWLSSQKRDLEIIMGEVTPGSENIGGDEWRRGGNHGAWSTANARESVNVLLSRQR